MSNRGNKLNKLSDIYKTAAGRIVDPRDYEYRREFSPTAKPPLKPVEIPHGRGIDPRGLIEDPTDPLLKIVPDQPTWTPSASAPALEMPEEYGFEPSLVGPHSQQELEEQQEADFPYGIPKKDLFSQKYVAEFLDYLKRSNPERFKVYSRLNSESPKFAGALIRAHIAREMGYAKAKMSDSRLDEIHEYLRSKLGNEEFRNLMEANDWNVENVAVSHLASKFNLPAEEYKDDILSMLSISSDEDVKEVMGAGGISGAVQKIKDKGDIERIISVFDSRPPAAPEYEDVVKTYIETPEKIEEIMSALKMILSSSIYDMFSVIRDKYPSEYDAYKKLYEDNPDNAANIYAKLYDLTKTIEISPEAKIEKTEREFPTEKEITDRIAVITGEKIPSEGPMSISARRSAAEGLLEKLNSVEKSWKDKFEEVGKDLKAFSVTPYSVLAVITHKYLPIVHKLIDTLKTEETQEIEKPKTEEATIETVPEKMPEEKEVIPEDPEVLQRQIKLIDQKLRTKKPISMAPPEESEYKKLGVNPKKVFNPLFQDEKETLGQTDDTLRILNKRLKFLKPTVEQTSKYMQSALSKLQDLKNEASNTKVIDVVNDKGKIIKTVSPEKFEDTVNKIIEERKRSSQEDLERLQSLKETNQITPERFQIVKKQIMKDLSKGMPPDGLPRGMTLPEYIAHEADIAPSHENISKNVIRQLISHFSQEEIAALGGAEEFRNLIRSFSSYMQLHPMGRMEKATSRQRQKGLPKLTEDVKSMEQDLASLLVEKAELEGLKSQIVNIATVPDSRLRSLYSYLNFVNIIQSSGLDKDVLAKAVHAITYMVERALEIGNKKEADWLSKFATVLQTAEEQGLNPESEKRIRGIAADKYKEISEEIQEILSENESRNKELNELKSKRSRFSEALAKHEEELKTPEEIAAGKLLSTPEEKLEGVTEPDIKSSEEWKQHKWLVPLGLKMEEGRLVKDPDFMDRQKDIPEPNLDAVPIEEDYAAAPKDKEIVSFLNNIKDFISIDDASRKEEELGETDDKTIYLVRYNLFPRFEELRDFSTYSIKLNEIVNKDEDIKNDKISGIKIFSNNAEIELPEFKREITKALHNIKAPETERAEVKPFENKRAETPSDQKFLLDLNSRLPQLDVSLISSEKLDEEEPKLTKETYSLKSNDTLKSDIGDYEMVIIERESADGPVVAQITMNKIMPSGEIKKVHPDEVIRALESASERFGKELISPAAESMYRQIRAFYNFGAKPEVKHLKKEYVGDVAKTVSTYTLNPKSKLKTRFDSWKVEITQITDQKGNKIITEVKLIAPDEKTIYTSESSPDIFDKELMSVFDSMFTTSDEKEIDSGHQWEKTEQIIKDKKQGKELPAKLITKYETTRVGEKVEKKPVYREIEISGLKSVTKEIIKNQKQIDAVKEQNGNRIAKGEEPLPLPKAQTEIVVGYEMDPSYHVTVPMGEGLHTLTTYLKSMAPEVSVVPPVITREKIQTQEIPKLIHIGKNQIAYGPLNLKAEKSAVGFDVLAKKDTDTDWEKIWTIRDKKADVRKALSNLVKAFAQNTFRKSPSKILGPSEIINVGDFGMRIMGLYDIAAKKMPDDSIAAAYRTRKSRDEGFKDEWQPMSVPADITSPKEFVALIAEKIINRFAGQTKEMLEFPSEVLEKIEDILGTKTSEDIAKGEESVKGIIDTGEQNAEEYLRDLFKILEQKGYSLTKPPEEIIAEITGAKEPEKIEEEKETVIEAPEEEPEKPKTHLKKEYVPEKEVTPGRYRAKIAFRPLGATKPTITSIEVANVKSSGEISRAELIEKATRTAEDKIQSLIMDKTRLAPDKIVDEIPVSKIMVRLENYDTDKVITEFNMLIRPDTGKRIR